MGRQVVCPLTARAPYPTGSETSDGQKPDHAGGSRGPGRDRLGVGRPTVGRMAILIEQAPLCLGPSREHHLTVGWQPCHCTAGRTGHRTFWCLDCRLEISVPVCWQKHRTALQNGLRFPDR